LKFLMLFSSKLFFNYEIFLLIYHIEFLIYLYNYFIRYVYGGIVGLENVETKFIFDLMLIANEFELVELSKKLETILIEDKASWLKTHFSFVYRTIFVKENFKDLENF